MLYTILYQGKPGMKSSVIHGKKRVLRCEETMSSITHAHCTFPHYENWNAIHADPAIALLLELYLEQSRL